MRDIFDSEEDSSAQETEQELSAHEENEDDIVLESELEKLHMLLKHREILMDISQGEVKRNTKRKQKHKQKQPPKLKNNEEYLRYVGALKTLEIMQ